MEELLKLRENLENAKLTLDLLDQQQTFTSIEDKVNYDLMKRRAWNQYNELWSQYNRALDSYKDPT